MFKDLTIVQWIAIGLAVALALHGFKIVDLTTLPGVGPLFAKFLSPWKLKAKPATPVGVLVTTDTLSPEDRCNVLFENITALRHYASEQPKERASACLDACDVLWNDVTQTHKLHTQTSA